MQLLNTRDAWVLGAIAAALLFAALLVRRLIRSRRPSSEEMERRRCELLSATGRITDGILLEAQTLPGRAGPGSGDDGSSRVPEVLVYSYRIAGVTYSCAQDVSRLQEHIPGLDSGQGIADRAIQVRYDPHNPGNSILLSESWTGLWTRKAKSG